MPDCVKRFARVCGVTFLGATFCLGVCLAEDPTNTSDTDTVAQGLRLDVERGISLAEKQQFIDARDVLKAALAGLEDVHGKNSVELVPAVTALANVSAARRQPRTHIRLVNRARKLIAGEYGKASIEYADLSLSLGEAAIRARRAYASRADIKGYELVADAHDIHSKLLGTADSRTRRSALILGQRALERGPRRLKFAELYFLTASEGSSSDNPESRHEHVEARLGLAATYVLLGRSEEAGEHCAAAAKLTHQLMSDSQEYRPEAPEYPRRLYEYGKEGYVDLSFKVDENGFARSLQLIGREGHRAFIPPAVKYLCSMRHEDRTEDGEPETVEIVKTRVWFDLN